VDLTYAHKVARQVYHQSGAGRKPISPEGKMNMWLLMLLKGWSIRRCIREVKASREYREFCLIEEGEKVYSRSRMSEFIDRMKKHAEDIFYHKAVQLLKRVRAKRIIACIDASFHKAYSRRDSENPSIGYSDRDAKVGKTKDGLMLGYKDHAVCIPQGLVIALECAPANENEDRRFPSLWSKTKAIASKAGKRIKRLLGDTAYSSDAIRMTLAMSGVEAIIPYPSNQHKGEKGLLREDDEFKTHGPYHQRLKYRKRMEIEHIWSRLDEMQRDHIYLRGIEKVYAQDLMKAFLLNLIWEAAHNIGKACKARSVTYFNP